MLLNVLNNCWFPNVRDRDLTMGDFKPDLSEECWRQFKGGTASPSRTLANLFLMQLPWHRIQGELGKIRILDVGCGSGNNGPRLQSWSGGKVSSYVGVDMRAHDNWKGVVERHAECRFYCADALDISSYLPDDASLIMSQSAIEHFQRDMDFFSEICAFIRHRVKPVIQVHLFPSAAGIRLYRWHGVRQYTPRTVSLLSRMFSEFSYSRLYRLGGAACNELHVESITTPLLAKPQLDKLRPRPGLFSDRVREAIEDDIAGVSRDASFYALVTHSHARERIFR